MIVDVPVGDATAPAHLANGRRESVQRVRTRIALVVTYVLSSLLYLWTLLSTGATFNFGAPQRDDYNLLADGFLKGHLSLALAPPPGLLKLRNPYDPALNNPYQQGAYHDLVFYHGHFFLTWGPTPVVTLLMPWRILHVGAMPSDFALFLYCLVGLACSFLLLAFLVNSYLPKVRTWQVTLGAAALAAGNLAPFLLRSPLVYEVNISASLCFAMAGLYLLASGGLAGRYRPWRLAAGSLCLGLSAGAHEDEALLGIFLLVMAARAWRRSTGERWRSRLGPAVPLVAPFAGVMVLLLAYNAARFGSPTQFGARYQLAGFNPLKTAYYQFGYLAPSLYYYLVAPVRWTLGFPYFVLPPPPAYPGAVPASYTPEVIGGIATTTPIVLALLGLPSVVRRKRIPTELAGAVVVAVATALLIVASIAFGIPGGSMRYEADFAPLLIFAALMVWFSASAARRRWLRRSTKVLGTIAIVYGVLVGVAISFVGYYNEYPKAYTDLETSQPRVYWALARLTSPFPTLVTMLLGHPVLSYIQSPQGVAINANYTSLGTGNGKDLFFYLSPDPTNVQVMSPSSGTWYLHGGFGDGPALAKGQKLRIEETYDGKTYASAYVAGEYYLPPVHLHTGLNRIQLSAVPETGTAGSEDPLVQIYGFFLSHTR
ncbi:MAG TPA: hypothetical protein VMU75_02685 [Acidimicrobiales bacterium]|nr:hypothetical protein [Acidimicrobiales bacterium]